MEKIILFGAGQIGAAVARLMGPGFEVLCFADNNEPVSYTHLRAHET